MDAKTLQPVLILCASLAGLLIVACNAQNTASDGGGTTANTGTAASNASTNTLLSSPLVGTWYGRARLDMDRVQQHLETLTDPYQREDFRAMVNSFLSTEMAARFESNGSMELDVQIQPAGQPVTRGSSIGSWRLLESTSDSVLIETAEQLANGSTAIDRVRYQFAADGNVAYMVAGVNALLANCNPLMVFDRVAETGDQVANQPASDGTLR
jgi:hypothetical protein